MHNWKQHQWCFYLIVYIIVYWLYLFTLVCLRIVRTSKYSAICVSQNLVQNVRAITYVIFDVLLYIIIIYY